MTSSLVAWLRYEVIHVWGLVMGMRAINVGNLDAGVDAPAVPTRAQLNQWGRAAYANLWADIAATLMPPDRPMQSGRGLEIGCGQGEGLGYLTTATPLDWDAVDLSLAATLISRWRGHRVRRAASQALPYADAAFQVVVAVESVMLFPDAQRSLGELRRVLAPGGRIGLAEFRQAGCADTRALIDAACGASGLRCLSFVDRTEAARRAIIHGEPARAALARWIPGFLRRHFADTLSLEGTARHRRWLDGSHCYWSAVLARADD